MLRTRVHVGPVAGLILSLLFAALLTALGTFELLIQPLEPAFGQQAKVALRVPYSARLVRQGAEAVWSVHYEHNRIVVPRGTTLRPTSEEHRAAVLFDATRRPPGALQLVSTFALYLFASLLLVSYVPRFGHSRLRLLRSQLGLLAMILVTVILARALLLLTALPDFWIPLAALGLWTTVGFDRRTGILIGLIGVFLVASLMRFDLLLLAVLGTQGLAAALLLFNRKRPRQMLVAGTLSGIVAALAYVALVAVLEGQMAVGTDLARGLGSNVLACVGGGTLSGIIALLLREVAMLVQGHVSRDKLLDLTDIESPLLQKMATEAPGSWEHSRAMANLAEAAAASIGADSLLTRVGAYYHDVGKTVQPQYFIENLAPGEPSPHDDLEPEVSADAIMAHVVLGTRMLREASVPEPVVEFAYTHHGTQRVEYFWQQYQQLHAEDDNQLGDGHFRYPGMKPLSKETAILMLVDSVEAASRTVSPPDRKRFEAMIRQVVFGKLAAGELDESGMTIPELRIMSERLASTLVNMYHGRVKYPWQLERERTGEPPSVRDGAGGDESEGEAESSPSASDGEGADEPAEPSASSPAPPSEASAPGAAEGEPMEADELAEPSASSPAPPSEPSAPSAPPSEGSAPSAAGDGPTEAHAPDDRSAEQGRTKRIVA